MELNQIIEALPVETRVKVLPALKVLVDAKLFTLIARQNANQLVDGRMDSDDEAAVVKEIREHRQTNRILLGFESLIADITKGIEDA